MTTDIRALPSRSSSFARPKITTPHKPSMATIVLALIVMLSGLAVVYLTDLNRRLFIEMQAAQATQNQLHIEWGKLLLEQGTWSTQARIQNIAQLRLGMQAPNTANVIMLKEES